MTDMTLADRIRQCLSRRRNITSKRMFGCVVFLLNGNVLVGVWKGTLIVRVGREDYEDALTEPHVLEFDITGKAMNGWVSVGPAGTASDHDLMAWIEKAIQFVRTLPAK